MKDRISITIDKELLEWIDKKVSEKVFSNRSHALEYLILKKKNAEHANLTSYSYNVSLDFKNLSEKGREDS